MIDIGFNEIIKNLNLDKQIIIDRARITNSIDIDEINEQLVISYVNRNDDEPDHKDISHQQIDDIDELFER